MQAQSIGTLIMGDLNIRQQSWLVHSSGNTPEGEALRNICDDYALLQLIKQPTRGKYLLDLCLTDLSN